MLLSTSTWCSMNYDILHSCSWEQALFPVLYESERWLLLVVLSGSSLHHSYFLHIHELIRTVRWILKGTLHRSLEFCVHLSHLWHSVVWTLDHLAYREFWLQTNLRRLLSSVLSSLPCTTAYKLSQNSNLEQCLDLMLFVYHLSVITVFHYLMSDILRTIISYILSCFSLTSGKRGNLIIITHHSKNQRSPKLLNILIILK